MDVDSPHLSQEQLVSAAEFLLRYSHGQEYAESELQLVLRASNAAGLPSAMVEHLFLANHVEYVKSACVPALIKCAAEPNMERLLSAVSRMWLETVYPSNLAELGVLSADGIETLRSVFSTLVRAFVDIPGLLDWVSGLGDVHLLQDLCKIGLDEETNAVLAQLVPQKINEYVQFTWRSRYVEGVHAKVERWVRDSLLPMVREVLALQRGVMADVPEQAVLDLAMTSLARLRIEELYDIIDTGARSGLDDLAQVLASRPDLRDETVRGFTKQCELRLLNGASDTVEIIQMFLKTVKAFSILDPQGVLLEKVSEPIRFMLKERADTSVKLAEGIFRDPSSPLDFLFDELRSQAKPQTNSGIQHAFLTWTPDPIDTPADFVRKQTQDSVSTLINLYDNKEVFIKQFVNLFSTELLTHPFDHENVLTRLNELYGLLGTRFGTSNMQRIAVMLEDVQRSGDVNREIQKDRESNLSAIAPLILSRLYWPSLPKKSDKQLLPPRFRELFNDYVAAYKKQPKYNTVDLELLPNRGRVWIEIQLADRVLDMAVLPEQAILISAFSNDNDTEGEAASYTLTELLESTSLDEPQLLAAIQFWVDQGVIGTQGEKYRVLETAEEVEEQRKGPSQVVSSAQLAPLGSVSSKQAKDPFEEMHVYWSYIVGMLTNLGVLPLDKIHSFLVMLVPNDDPYVKTKQELESYLMAMVDENKLEHDDGKFSLVKK